MTPDSNAPSAFASGDGGERGVLQFRMVSNAGTEGQVMVIERYSTGVLIAEGPELQRDKLVFAAFGALAAGLCQVGPSSGSATSLAASAVFGLIGLLPFLDPSRSIKVDKQNQSVFVTTVWLWCLRKTVAYPFASVCNVRVVNLTGESSDYCYVQMAVLVGKTKTLWFGASASNVAHIVELIEHELGLSTPVKPA
jgi:hypothetical protein